MAILKVEKFWLILPKEKEEKVVDTFKNFENVHWEKLTGEENTEKSSPYDSYVTKLDEIFKILRIFYPEGKGFLEAFFSGREEITEEEFEKLRTEVSIDSLYKEAKNLERVLNVIEDKKKRLFELYEETAYWLDINEDLNFPRVFKRFILYSGTFSRDEWSNFLEESKDILEESWYRTFVNNKNVKVIFIIPKQFSEVFENLLQKHNFIHKRIPYLKDSPQKSLERIQKSLNKVDEDLKNLYCKAKELLDKKKNIFAWYDYYITKIKETGAKNLAYRSNYFAIFSGWIPKKDKEKFLSMLRENISDFVFESKDPDKDDDPPVILDNPKIIKPFEFLTRLYGLPPYGFIDPTPFMAPFYMLFFGICLGDIGYGLLLLISSLWIKNRYKPEDDTKQLLDLLTVLSIPSIIVGTLTWSFFGNQPLLGPDGKFLKVFPLINPSQDLITALGISLSIGVASQFYALILRFISCLKIKDYEGALYDAGLWILFLGSLLVYFGSKVLGIKFSGVEIFKYILIFSLVGLVLTQGRDKKGIARILVGLISLYGIMGGYGLTSFVGDVLSYSRLFALNLVGSIFGFVITQLANMVKGIPVLGWIFLVLIWVGGQVLNFVLSTLSAFVHSTRLQFLELYGRFFVDGGRKFFPYKIEGKFFRIKKNYDGR
ncbi:V-type ATP synthase subunit I [Dictyoglomus sp.]|jgi:V/A-type H+-transporting ATPase subunit I|uniref:V-type ATP synthase subunit I n=1 Tax=Dictyoglomus sp. TaxID=28205 RepID=UPI003D117B4A